MASLPSWRRRIWRTTPSNSSATLCCSGADVSMNLQSNTTAQARPSGEWNTHTMQLMKKSCVGWGKLAVPLVTLDTHPPQRPLWTGPSHSYCPRGWWECFLPGGCVAGWCGARKRRRSWRGQSRNTRWRTRSQPSDSLLERSHCRHHLPDGWTEETSHMTVTVILYFCSISIKFCFWTDITGGMTCSCSENSEFSPLFRASCIIIIINTDALLDVWKGANRRQLWGGLRGGTNTWLRVLILFWWHQKFSNGKTLTHKRATCLSLSQVSMTMSVVSSPSTVSVRSYVSTAITNNELCEQHESSQQ